MMHHYVTAEAEHVATLRCEPRAVDGVRAMIERVIAEARKACLGVNSICEFGRTRRELTKIHDAAARVIHAAIVARVREAQAAGDVAPDLDPEEVAGFISAIFVAIRIAARGGADGDQLQASGEWRCGLYDDAGTFCFANCFAKLWNDHSNLR